MVDIAALVVACRYETAVSCCAMAEGDRFAGCRAACHACQMMSEDPEIPVARQLMWTAELRECSSSPLRAPAALSCSILSLSRPELRPMTGAAVRNQPGNGPSLTPWDDIRQRMPTMGFILRRRSMQPALLHSLIRDGASNQRQFVSPVSSGPAPVPQGFPREPTVERLAADRGPQILAQRHRS